MVKFLPTRSEVLRKIDILRNAPQGREDVAAWAISIIDDDEIQVDDMRLWDVIKNIGGADILIDIGVYLYNDQDFDEWKKDLSI